MKSAEATARDSLQRYVRAGVAIVILVVFGMGGWAATAQLSGAVVGEGFVVVASRIKHIRHPTGGIIRTVRVHDGDHVKAGQILIQLDPTQVRATAAIISHDMDDLLAREARLEAERDGLDEIKFPPELESREGVPGSEAARAIASERRLFKIRRNAREGERAQLMERRSQLQIEISGYQGQIESKEKERTLIHKELKSVQTLWNEKLTPLTRLVSLQREATRVDGERDQLTSMTAQARAKISEINLKILQIGQDLRKTVGKDLIDTQTHLSELAEKKIAAMDQLKRLDIRAPQSGYVHELTAYTVGGVIKAGEQIMMIVPDEDAFQVEVKIDPHEIEQIHQNQRAELRFSAFNQRVTPQITGFVNFISADTVQDQRTGRRYYSVRIVLPQKEIAKIKREKIVPGMPVEAFIQTHERTALSYLLKPLTDQMQKAFKR